MKLTKKFSMQYFSKLFVLLIILATAQGCATNPVTGDKQLAKSEKWEAKVGPQYHQQLMKQYQVYDDPELQAYVNEIGQKLAAQSHRPDLKFTFTLLDDPMVNAFALPGGFIYITRGIMAYMNKESHLAGVIGHEIGHVTARHGAQRARQQELATVATMAVAIGTGNSDLMQMSQMLGGALMSGYGRKQELQSDRLGAEYIAKNNYNPQDMIEVVGILKDQELFAREKARREGTQPPSYHGLFASHPRNDQRLQEVIRAAEQHKDASQPVPDDGRFLRLTNGMTFGESESQGITRGNRFYHKGMNLFIEFPEGWKVINQPTQLVAVSRDRSQIIRMQMAPDAQGTSPSNYLRSKFQAFRDGRSVRTGDGQAYAGVATLSDQRSGQRQNVLVSNVQRAGQSYVLLAQGKQYLPDREFVNVIGSVRGLRSSEQKLASERNIKLVKVRRGDTIASLARKSNLDTYAESQIRLINGLYPTGEPQVGQWIKIIK